MYISRESGGRERERHVYQKRVLGERQVYQKRERWERDQYISRESPGREREPCLSEERGRLKDGERVCISGGGRMSLLLAKLSVGGTEASVS